MDKYIDSTGAVWSVHSREKCALINGHCVIHSPSLHAMRGWATFLRNDRAGLVERICPHGVGHPDPDSIAYFRTIDPYNRGAWGVHGCDGCCSKAKALAGG